MAMTFVHDDVLDGGLDYLAANADTLYLCSAAPTTHTEASSTYALADIAIDSGDFTKSAEGDGRKTTVGAQADVPVDVSGTASHWAISDAGNTKLLAAGTLASSVAVDDAGNVDIAAFVALTLNPTLV